MVNKLLVRKTYNCCGPWVYKDISDGLIAADLFFMSMMEVPSGPQNWFVGRP